MQTTNKYLFSLSLQSVTFLQIAGLINNILTAKKHPDSPMASHPSTRGEYQQADTSHWEKVGAIHELPLLYKLTNEEIEIIENL